MGQPLKVLLSEGQVHEMKRAHELCSGVRNTSVLGDRAYDAHSLIAELEERGCTVVIPSNPTRSTQRKIDKHLYKDRCLVEHFFQKLKRFRRVATRYEKTARNYLAFVHLASIVIWLA